MTALILAVLNQSIEMVVLLLEHGAAIDLAEAVSGGRFSRLYCVLPY